MAILNDHFRGGDHLTDTDATGAAQLMSDAHTLATGLSLQLKIYAVAGVPAVADHVGGLIWVTDDAGGATVAVSDGTNWVRIRDNVTVAV